MFYTPIESIAASDNKIAHEHLFYIILVQKNIIDCSLKFCVFVISTGIVLLNNTSFCCKIQESIRRSHTVYWLFSRAWTNCILNLKYLVCCNKMRYAICSSQSRAYRNVQFELCSKTYQAVSVQTASNWKKLTILAIFSKCQIWTDAAWNFRSHPLKVM